MALHERQKNQCVSDAQDSSRYDVIVIGGGPAGSTTATLLSQWGRRVLLLEKERFPRHHIGESLLAGTTSLMKQLGVYEKVEQAGFIRKYGATYIWGKNQEPWFISFSEVSSEDRYSFQVERARFDKLLLDHCREAGTIVQEECRVTDVLYEGERVIGVRYIDSDQVSHVAYAHYCVDATGQSALLGSARKLRKFNQTLRNFALYTYFRGGRSAVELVPELREKDKGNIFVVAMEKGWVWYIPLNHDRYSVGVVTHADMAKELSKEKRLAFFFECLETTPQIQYLLRDAEMETSHLYSQSDWSYVCDSFKGPGYLLVGDAACFVDPILSTGVDLAMEGAFKAALAINTSLTEPSLSEQALTWYEEEYKTKANHFLQMAEHWYHGHRNQDEWFWKAQRLVDPAANLSVRQAFILLTGGFTTGSGDQDLPALKSFGGFRPFQLRTIYANLDHDLADALEQMEPACPSDSCTHEASPATTLTALEDRCPVLRSDMHYSPSMLEESNRLVPVIRIVQDLEGVSLTRLILPQVSLSLLEHMDGVRSIGTILHEILPAANKSSHELSHETLSHEMALSIFEELYKQQVCVAS